MMEVQHGFLITWVAENFYWVFLGFLLVNILQRRNQKRAGRKRFATLYLAIAAFLIMASAQVIILMNGQDWMLVLAVGLIALVVYRYREHTLPFRLHSLKDGRRLTWQEILYYDDV
jgi:amino acid transporter